MSDTRHLTLSVADTSLSLPCFFPSVSSVKTNLMPVDYIELLEAAACPLFLVSAYDIAHSNDDDRRRVKSAIERSMKKGSVILMDSGNYERFWKGGQAWETHEFHTVCRTYEHHLCFCYDNQSPPSTLETISQDVIASVLRDQEHAIGTVLPIIHGPTELLPTVARIVAEELCPILLAVPERLLGEGIVARVRSVRAIRRELDGLEVQCGLHLLGTGNPLSIAAYAAAGADSFDGLEWCQTVVDHSTGLLFHFQQWDFFREQTKWGKDRILPYTQSVLMHNLEFYATFIRGLQMALRAQSTEYLYQYFSQEKSDMIRRAIEGFD